MLETLIVAGRDRERLAEILSVVTRFGLTGLLSRMGLARRSSAADAQDLPNRTRGALEQLGPTYIKLGQILATRRDLLNDEWTAAFEQLQSGAPQLPFSALEAQVEASLGEPVDSAFAYFDTTPLAAASIAQVHRARLASGREVVVKIRRPAIRPRMEADLRLLRHLAGLAEANSAEARRFRPQALVDQLARDILDELDFTREGRNADLIRADHADDGRIIVPTIHWQYSSEDLLVMDYIDGIAPRDPAVLRAHGIDPAAIAELGAELVMSMVLIHGRFHGDPHPGNLLCLAGNKLALLDLGSVGLVSSRRQHEFLTFILGLQTASPAAVADMLMLWSKDVPISRERLLTACERLVARHSGGPLMLSAVIADFFPLLRQEGLILPPDLLLVFKAMITIDGVLARIEPSFDLTASLQNMRGTLLKNRLHSAATGDRAQALLLELLRIGEEAPQLMRRISDFLDRQPSAADPAAKNALLTRTISRAGYAIAAAILLHAAAMTWL
jgi:ubiquinone biosynthesis protein